MLLYCFKYVCQWLQHTHSNFRKCYKKSLPMVSTCISSNFRICYKKVCGIVSCQLDSLVMSNNYINPKINYVVLRRYLNSVHVHLLCMIKNGLGYFEIYLYCSQLTSIIIFLKSYILYYRKAYT